MQEALMKAARGPQTEITIPPISPETDKPTAQRTGSLIDHEVLFRLVLGQVGKHIGH
jgi:hypothetical protein